MDIGKLPETGELRPGDSPRWPPPGRDGATQRSTVEE